LKRNTRCTAPLPRLAGILSAAGALCLLLSPLTATAQNAPHKNAAKPAAAVSTAPMDTQDAANAILADSVSGLRAQVDRHFHEGEYNHIVNLERIIVQAEPADYHAYEDSAWLLWSMDRNAEAVAFLKQGLQANPKTFEFYDELGAHYLTRLHDAKSALPYYEQAIKFKCPFFTWNNLAHCYEKTNQWDKAVEAWQSAAKFPNNLIAVRRLERARHRLPQNSNGSTR
jgi:tetratricopeptide (TPR) repeat protein